MPAPWKKLILFDIDGTLLYASSDYGGRAMVRALENVFRGKTFSRERVRLGGRCDPAILRDVAGQGGISEDQLSQSMDQILSKYQEFMKEETKRWAGEVVQCDGVGSLLDNLRGSYDLGLLTGNFPSIAMIKLDAIGISKDLFPIGAFGTDSDNRNDLPKIAINNAQNHYGRKYEKEQILLVGDTIEDIDCAHFSGIDCLAVGTGCTSAKDLAEHTVRPTWVVEDLTDNEKIEQIFRGNL